MDSIFVIYLTAIFIMLPTLLEREPYLLLIVFFTLLERDSYFFIDMRAVY